MKIDLDIQKNYKLNLDNFTNYKSKLAEEYNSLISKIKMGVLNSKKLDDNWKTFQDMVKDYKSNFEALTKIKSEGTELSRFVTNQIEYGLMLEGRNREIAHLDNQIEEALEILEVERLNQILETQYDSNVRTKDDHLARVNELKENIKANPMFVQEKLDLLKKTNKNVKKK